MNDNDKKERFSVENVLEGSIRAWSALVETLALAGKLDRHVLCEKIKGEIDRLDGKVASQTIVAMRRYLIHVLDQPGVVDSHDDIAVMLRREPIVSPKEAPQPRHFNIRFSKALHDYLRTQEADPKLAGAIPGFIEALGEGDEGILMLGFYESALARDQDLFQLFESSGVHFLIPQIKLKEKLLDKTIDIENGRVFIVGG